MATLKLENISKKFGRDTWGVRKVDLEVEDREFVVFLGPSGCGKTTTLRMISGLELVTTGTVYIDGRDVTDDPPRSRNVSMVFQNIAVWPHMTVYENIAFALRLKKEGRERIDKKVKEAAQLVKIPELLQRYPSQLSGGQAQRVSLARAIVVEPKLFLLDEPLSSLDALLRVAMRTELKEIHRKAEATSIFVTHDQSEALSVADRIVIMNEGSIVQTGTPDDVYFRPADRFVAGFIGMPPTNFFPVDITSREERIVLEGPHFSLQLNQENSRALKGYDQDRLTLGVRPEDITLVGKDEAVFSHEALVVEPQGSHQIIAFELDDEIIKIRAPADVEVEAGDSIPLAFDQEKLHLFAADDGRRLNDPAEEIQEARR
jgi:multiple sugar transport system ATP-binding protein